MRIGFYTSIAGWGGSETFLRDLMLGIRASGHDVVLVGIEGTRLADEARNGGIEFVPWRGGDAACGKNAPPSPSSRNRWRGAWSLMPSGVKLAAGNFREARQLADVLRAARLDVLHVNVNGYEVAGLAARRIGLPAVGCYLIVPPPERHLVRRFFQALTLRSYRHLVVQSEIGRASVLDGVRFMRAPVSVIPNGIELPERLANPFSRCGSGKECRLISMGRLHPMKGHADAIRALALLPEGNVALTILGEGPEAERLSALTVELGVQNRVTFEGHVDGFLPRLCAADGFVMASVSHESCPASLLFAMAVGLPVVTSDLPALTEVNRAGITGYVAKTGDSASLAFVIQRLCADPAAAIRMGQAGRSRIAERYSLPSMVESWGEVYDALARRAHRKSGTREAEGG